MAAYLTLAEFTQRTLAPPSYLDQVAGDHAGWIDTQLDLWSRWLDSRLRKRYAAPFESPYPEAVTQWLEQIVTYLLYLKRGIDSTDGEISAIRELAEAARAEVKEAADSDKGLFDLPLRADTTASGISVGGPLGYTETSPYRWTTVQRELGAEEDDL